MKRHLLATRAINVKIGEPGKRAFFSNNRSGCRSCRNAERKRAFCFRANWITRSFVIMTDQLKIETIARSRRTSLPAMVACSNAKSKPPAAINESISASPAELLADSDESERASRVPRSFWGTSDAVSGRQRRRGQSRSEREKRTDRA